MIFLARANMPTFIQYTVIDGEKVPLCSFCKSEVLLDDRWRHVTYNCEELKDLRESVGINNDVKLELIYSPSDDGDEVKILANYFVKCFSKLKNSQLLVRRAR
jgi:hypothetical protein